MKFSCETLVELISDVLDFSNIEQGDLDLRPESLPLRILLQDVGDEFCDRAKAKAIKLEVLLAPDLPQGVEADPVRLAQVLSNLIDNALKFTDSGAITIDAYCRNVTPSHATVTVSIMDTGIGMDREMQAIAFDVFQQDDSSNTRRYQDTGLGLAIVRKLVEMMGGDIALTSQPGRGTNGAFTVQLPVVDAPRPARRPDAVRQPAPRAAVVREPLPWAMLTRPEIQKKLTVLLVEDNEVNQKLAARLLDKLGCAVHVAHDGVDALTKVQQASYDLIFMDCQMPNMAGYEATSKIRELETQSETRTPIIALTANSLPSDRVRSEQAGMDEFLTKPIGKEKLREALSIWAPTMRH